ncbi:MAG: ABC-type polysaccharide/polyol phosphate export permease [Desulforhopalus sp.]|jgi:ABC-type polysaccharide/polyol phosphate export permease
MINTIFSFLTPVWSKRRLILLMANREIKGNYVGSVLGFAWILIHPAVMITVFWFVFSMGFKVQPLNDVPFVVWLTAGLAPWFFFVNIVSGSTSSIVDNSHLIKKTIFFPQVLPVVKICSSIITHVVFVLILLLLILFQGVTIDLWALQSFYYLFCLLALAIGISWGTSALNVFVRDIGQVVAISLQVGFWLTPIFWDLQMMPAKVQFLLKLNPVYYIVQGYRDSFINGTGFWEHPVYSLYFWCCTITILFLGGFVFRRLRPQFSDVL